MPLFLHCYATETEIIGIELTELDCDYAKWNQVVPLCTSTGLWLAFDVAALTYWF
jgi:hypothetical protein